jgi:hypothetical protein
MMMFFVLISLSTIFALFFPLMLYLRWLLWLYLRSLLSLPLLVLMIFFLNLLWWRFLAISLNRLWVVTCTDTTSSTVTLMCSHHASAAMHLTAHVIPVQRFPILSVMHLGSSQRLRLLLISMVVFAGPLPEKITKFASSTLLLNRIGPFLVIQLRFFVALSLFVCLLN